MKESVCVSPPLNVPYLAAVLREAGHRVSVLDCPPLGVPQEEVERHVRDAQPDAVGITSLSQTFTAALQVAETAKAVAPETPVILGGPHVTFLDRETLQENPSVDAVVRREGEETVVELADRLERGKGLEGVRGVTYRDGARIRRNPDRPFIEDLDGLPFPAYDLLPLDRYGTLGGRRIFLVLSSRGCPYRCAFCSMRVLDGARFRSRSPESTVEEIAYIQEHGADAFSFCDETFTLKPSRVEAICRLILAEGPDIPWDCQTRADRLSPDLLRLMRRAGCELICIGAESGSQRILDAMRKGTTVQQNLDAVRLIQKAGIPASVSTMMGYPGETEEEVGKTVDFIWDAKPDIAYLNIATPFPGTAFYEHVKSEGWSLDQDWGKYDITVPVYGSPDLDAERLTEIRSRFYRRWYSLGYVFRNLVRSTFYNRLMAHFALTYLAWRVKSGVKNAIFRTFR